MSELDDTGKPVGYTTLSRYLKALITCQAKGYDIVSGLWTAMEYAAELEAELAVLDMALDDAAERGFGDGDFGVKHELVERARRKIAQAGAELAEEADNEDE